MDLILSTHFSHKWSHAVGHGFQIIIHPDLWSIWFSNSGWKSKVNEKGVAFIGYCKFPLKSFTINPYFTQGENIFWLYLIVIFFTFKRKTILFSMLLEACESFLSDHGFMHWNIFLLYKNTLNVCVCRHEFTHFFNMIDGYLCHLISWEFCVNRQWSWVNITHISEIVASLHYLFLPR